MRKRVRYLAHGALIGAMYAALTHLQNLLIPGSATWAIQFRASEALGVLAFFTPAAVGGLTVGCLVFNLSYTGALPLDALVGSLATLLAAGAMYMTRNITFKKIPVLGFFMPALFNAVLVGWELSWYIGGAFWLNAVYVAIGELTVMLTLGVLLYTVLQRGGLAQRILD